MTQFYSSGDIADRLSIPQYKLLYAIEHGMVADATLRVGGKRIFSEDDFQRLAEHFQVVIKTNENEEEKQNEI